jgi:NADPH:quinone reductase-like Zn-dependent oxidoreductase
MRAALIEVVGGAPRVETLGDPSRTGDDQVLIKVEAAALNAIDLYIATGHHRAGEPQLPYVPGIETVGPARSESSRPGAIPTDWPSSRP